MCVSPFSGRWFAVFLYRFVTLYSTHKRRRNKLDNSAILPDDSDKFAHKFKENVGATAPGPVFASRQLESAKYTTRMRVVQ